MSFSIDSVDTTSYADDNTPYTIWKNKCEVENKLEIASVKLFKRFYKNGMKANQEKCNFLSCLHITREFSLPDCSVQNSSSEKFLKLIMLQIYVIKQVKNSSISWNFSEYASNSQRKLLMNAYFLT